MKTNYFIIPEKCQELLFYPLHKKSPLKIKRLSTFQEHNDQCRQ